MDDTRHRLLRSLNQRVFRTGTQIGAELELTRAAVHKHVQALVAQGVPIHRVPGRGYRLADGVTLLEGGEIAARLADGSRSLLAGIEVLDEVDSTSAVLARRGAGEPFDGWVCLAEKQTAGRGRRGRSWMATPYRDLMMSVGIEYAQWPAELPTLGLVTAMALVDSLQALGAAGLKVKWPNDVVHPDGKLCGVLLDVTGEAHGTCRVTIGIGINVSAAGAARDIDQPWTDLEAVSGKRQDRNEIVAQCLERLLPAFRRFPAGGFAPYRAAWRRLDAVRDRWITIRGADGGLFEGRAAGVDDAGRLRATGADGKTRVFTQGDVSVRMP